MIHEPMLTFNAVILRVLKAFVREQQFSNTHNTKEEGLGCLFGQRSQCKLVFLSVCYSVWVCVSLGNREKVLKVSHKNGFKLRPLLKPLGFTVCIQTATLLSRCNGIV